jgi:hypothetical protein
MNNGDTDMMLKAVKIDTIGYWFKRWNLIDDNTGHVYGTMIYTESKRDHTHSYNIFIHNTVDPALWSDKTYSNTNREVALAWARNQIENQKEPTMEELESLLLKVKQSRYDDEMSDDFAYSNGKIDRWDRLEAKIRNHMNNGVKV